MKSQVKELATFGDYEDVEFRTRGTNIAVLKSRDQGIIRMFEEISMLMGSIKFTHSANLNLESSSEIENHLKDNFVLLDIKGKSTKTFKIDTTPEKIKET